MAFKIFMTSAAVIDLNTAKEYYNEKSDGLGKKLALEVELVLDVVA